MDPFTFSEAGGSRWFFLDLGRVAAAMLTHGGPGGPDLSVWLSGGGTPLDFRGERATALAEALERRMTAASDQEAERSQESARRRQHVTLLRALLADSPLPTADLLARAAPHGLTKADLDRVKDEAGVLIERQVGVGYVWRLVTAGVPVEMGVA
jgi:hypothetical protein